MSYQEQTTTNQTIAPTRDEKLATHDLFETASADRLLRAFMDLLNATTLKDLLRGPDLLTILAPTNEAFGAAERSVDEVAGYILRGAWTADELRASGSVKTMRGNSLEVSGNDAVTRIDGARVIRADIECTNGVIHVIDGLLQAVPK